VRIQYKLFLSLLGASLLLVVTLMVLVQWNISRGMLDYINNRQIQRAQTVALELADYYRTYGSWQGLQENPRLFHHIVLSALETGDQPPPESRRKKLPRPPLPLALLDLQHRAIAGHLPHPPIVTVPVAVDDATIGWLAVPQLREIRSGFEEQFLRRLRLALVVIGSASVALTALISLPLARHLVKPIRQLNRGTHQLTQGNYQVALPVTRRDELGRLARDFNELALALAANDSSRKRWLADISHELRTPLAILRGEVEAMLDGVRPLTRDNLQSIQQEVQHLGRLVNDLHALTTADVGGLQYRKYECDVRELWREQCAAHRAHFDAAGLRLEGHWPAAPIVLYGDEGRLRQLLDNLLDNSRKYTRAGGSARVTLRSVDNNVELSVDDSGPGVPPEALPKLFDHLFRVDNSRNRSTGGSGLGLAICQRIVAAHQGTISAAPSELGGLSIKVVIPMKPQTLA
jgi:two-component system sensor histidine kinase BaeS